MGYLQKLPLLLALMAALLTGLISIYRSIPQNEALVKMVFVLVIFYILGFLVRSTITNILEQIEQKQKEEELEAIRKEQEAEREKKEREALGKMIDYTAGKEEESFDPLPVSEFIRKELNHE